MSLSEFKKQPSEGIAFDVWEWKNKVTTPLGKFTVEFQIEDRKSPDEEMLKRAAELVQYAHARGDYIQDVVYGSYRLSALESEPGWLKKCGVPEDLKKEHVGKYVKQLTLVINRDFGNESNHENTIFMVPLWDEEQALYLEFQNGALVKANDSPFKLENGVMKLMEEPPKGTVPAAEQPRRAPTAKPR